jgi:hypothetical protein
MTTECLQACALLALNQHRDLMEQTQVLDPDGDQLGPVIAGINNYTFSSSNEQTSQCRLLLLPSELRDCIRELAFTTDDLEAEFDLFEAQQPNSSLLATGRQVFSEAQSLHIIAVRQFWSTMHFTVNNCRPCPPSRPAVWSFHPAKLELIQHLTIVGDHINFQFANGLWNGSWTQNSVGIARLSRLSPSFPAIPRNCIGLPNTTSLESHPCRPYLASNRRRVYPTSGGTFAELSPSLKEDEIGEVKKVAGWK